MKDQLYIAAACIALLFPPATLAADKTPELAQLEQDAGSYVKAMTAGAPNDVVQALHARFLLTQQLSARLGARDIVADRACFFPDLEGKRTGRTGLQVMVGDCFGLDPMKALVSSRYFKAPR